MRLLNRLDALLSVMAACKVSRAPSGIESSRTHRTSSRTHRTRTAACQPDSFILPTSYP